MAKDIATFSLGSTVIGIGNVDVRKLEDLEAVVEQCVAKTGGINYSAGAAKNFLASIRCLSVNVSKRMVDIDLLGSLNKIKATGCPGGKEQGPWTDKS
ncbi:peroxisomal 2 4-dienoyl-CoA reductase sps19 [Neonectria magnoliae]|uniref:Peroxisomal 2 4-dienoyl-CoA reductase sps19 n=1 Tax=Neonectria magnoliae TaxID=2732573 RepID=A0ABR1IDX3_9HYPO